MVGVFGLAFTLGALTAGAAIWRADHVAAGNTTSAAPNTTDAVNTSGELSTTGARDSSGDLRPQPEDAIDRPRVLPSVTPAPTSGSDNDVDADAAVRLLRMRRLELPVDGVSRAQLRDSFDERRSGIRRHEALDIMTPKGTPLRAVEDARVAKLFRSVAGGLTIYLFDPSEMFAYYYAHLDRYAAGLKEGQQVRRGEVIGFAGSTGNASEDAPHLHFAIFQLGSERRWWQGDAINPFPVLR